VTPLPEDDRPWLIRVVKPWIPAGLRQAFRATYRRSKLDRACRSIRRLKHHEVPNRSQLNRLRESWDNGGWPASTTCLGVIATQVRRTTGPILECGSGVSTVMLGLMTQGSGRPVWSLENDPRWADIVESELSRWSCGHVRVVRAPLVDRGEFAWYAAAPEELPESITLLVIDGPPAFTKGGRRGALHEVGRRLAPGAVVILDDAQREGEMEAWRDWTEHCGLRIDPDSGFPFDPTRMESGVAVGRIA